MKIVSSFIHNHHNFKQSRCSSEDEWINKLWCIYVMAYCSVTKGMRCQVMKGPTGSLNAYIFLSDRSQFEKVIHCMIQTTWYSGEGEKKKTMEK
jgi:hypothetical protein